MTIRRPAALGAARKAGLFAGAALVFAGCANLWDDVTSRDFHVRSLWDRTDPMTVLQESTDGDARARALRSLKEPRANGGSDVEQDRVMQVLAQSAVSDPHPLVRLSAIQTLGRFTDPRVVQALTAAYDAADQLPTETRAAIQSAALVSLGKTKQPAAAAALVRIATQPLPADAIEKDRSQARDVRLAALRALKVFEGSAEVAAAMTQVLRTERDVAIADRARETYAAVVGREPTETETAPSTTPPASAPGDIRQAGGRP